MPATNYTPIQFYRSTTSGNQPSAANLSPGELALNIADTDMTMYFENASGVVKRFFNNPAELKYPTADGTSGQGVKTDGSKTLSFGALASAAITNNTRQAVTSSATTTIDLASGQVIDLTMAANITTLSFTNVPASGTPVLVQIVVRNASSGTAYTIAWPNSVYWSGQYSATTINTIQTAPTLASGANGVTTIALLTTDGGTKWRGWVEGTIPGGTLNTMYSWGQSVDGSLGQNSGTTRSSPVQIGALTNWIKSFASRQTQFAIQSDQTLWSWGANAGGQLGQNNTINQSSPVQVGSLTIWSQLSSRGSHTLALSSSGGLWAWGYNTNGQLGQNNTVSTSSPVQIGSLTWSAIAASYRSSAAIRNDGTLWTWGSNLSGELGLNTAGFNARVSSPVQVGTLTNWANAAFSLVGAGGQDQSCAAIKTDGTLWAWGSNDIGQLAQNTSGTNRSSPIQVGVLSDWRQIAGGDRNFLAVKTDGTLWAWGEGANGKLGLNDANNRSSPTQIGALNTWLQVAAGSTWSMAVKTDGTLWAWGSNTYGKLGINDVSVFNVSRSSPVQVGALTTWSSISCGHFNSNGLITSTSVNPA